MTDPDPAKFTVALERPLSAEQLLRSGLEAAGEREALEPPSARGMEESGAAGNAPSAAPAGDAPTYASLQTKVAKAFANAPRDPEVEFAPTLKGALFVMNNDEWLSLLKRRPGNLVDRAMTHVGDARLLADELYLAILSRPATGDEVAEVADHLARHAAAPEKAVGQLAWALLASTEFCTNH